MITAFDDYPIHHSPAPISSPGSGDENLYDRYFFAGFSNRGEYYFGAALGVYPNRNVQDAHFSIAYGGKQHSFHASRRAPAHREDNSVGPMNVEVLEPMRRLRITIDANKTGIEAELVFTASTVPLQEPRSVMRVGKKVIMDVSRFAQFGHWRGWIKVAGQRQDIGEECLGVRDRSWGVRPAETPRSKLQIQAAADESADSPLRRNLEKHMTSALFPPLARTSAWRRTKDIAGLIGGGMLGVEPGIHWVWNLNFFDDICTHYASFETMQGEASQLSGAVIPRYAEPSDIPNGLDPGLQETHDAAHSIEWHPGTRIPKTPSVHMNMPNKAMDFAFEPRIIFHLGGLGYGHPDWPHGGWKGEEVIELETWNSDQVSTLQRGYNHIHQMCDVRCGDQLGVGIFESLCVGAYQPGGFQQRLDGAPGH